jgi:hypothetical protein
MSSEIKESWRRVNGVEEGFKRWRRMKRWTGLVKLGLVRL